MGVLFRNLPVTNDFPSQRASDVEVQWCFCYPVQAVEQTVVSSVNLNAWHLCDTTEILNIDNGNVHVDKIDIDGLKFILFHLLNYCLFSPFGSEQDGQHLADNIFK